MSPDNLQRESHERSPCLSHIIADVIDADEYWQLYHPACRNALICSHTSAEARSRYLRLKLATSWYYSYISGTSDFIVAFLSVLCRELQTWDDHWWRDVGPEFCKEMQAFSASCWRGTGLRSRRIL
jgi:hypothetical protein